MSETPEWGISVRPGGGTLVILLGLLEEAFERGIPIVRHPMLHCPDDPGVYEIGYQWMLGTEFMVVQVVDAGAENVDAYLPEGERVHLWSREIFDSSDGGRWHSVRLFENRVLGVR